MKILGKELTFNGNKIYHTGDKPTASEIGAAASSHSHNYAGASSAGGNANAAIKLATARTINGTNFDGSTNITTANWGTSRTITIGKTGKSVNGAGNVSWSLSEIGAADASHAHKHLMYNSLDGQTISLNTLNLSAGTTHVAYYYCPTDGGGSNITDRPNDSTKNAFNLKVELLRWASTTDYITKQTYTRGNEKISYVRYCTNGTWSAWEKMYTSVAKPTASEIGAAASSHTHNYAGSSSAGGAANSANTLSTARTINGTSFNGSANITTANWGTARTITIGNTGKSVNGSANVSWSLSEIGAAATSHTHSYLPLSGGSMTGKIANSFTTNTYLAGNQGNALISSSSAAGSYVMLYRYPSTNGYFTTGGYQGSYLLQYTAKSTVDAGTNSVTKSVTLLDESGNSSFSGTVKAPTFSGALSGNASTATKLQTARTINGVSFDGTANITIPIASHNHDSNYLKTSGTSTLSGSITVDVASERVIKTTSNVGYFFNSSRVGMYDWTNQRDVFAFNPSTNQLALGSGTITTKVNGTFYGINNIALARGGLWLGATGTTTTCDYLRFGTNIIASDDNKRMYLIDTGGARANVDMGDTSVYSLLLTNPGYPSIRFSNNVRIEYDSGNDALYAAGTKAQSGGLREFRATQCNSTVNAIIAGKRLFIQSGTPSGVATGDVWIQV